MFQHVLVPLDGSVRSEQALPVAARLVRNSRGRLTLLYVVRMAPEAASYAMEGPFLPQHVFKEDLDKARQYIHQVAQRSDLRGISLHTQVELGDPALSILSHRGTERSIDLILMSSHGYTGVKRWLLGSVAEKVAHHASVPVLLLQSGAALRTHLHADGTRAMRALVPLDTSARSMDAIPPTAALVAAFSSPGQGHIHLTHIVVMPEDAPTLQKEEQIQKAEQNLEKIGESIREGLVANVGAGLGVTFSWAAALAQDEASEIVRIAEAGEPCEGKEQGERFDLIALTTHGLTGIRRWTVGSTAERLLRTSHLPLLVVRPADILEKERKAREHELEASCMN